MSCATGVVQEMNDRVLGKGRELLSDTPVVICYLQGCVMSPCLFNIYIYIYMDATLEILAEHSTGSSSIYINCYTGRKLV